MNNELKKFKIEDQERWKDPELIVIQEENVIDLK